MTSNFFTTLFRKFVPAIVAIVVVLWLYKYYGAMEYTVKNLTEFFRLIYEHLILVIISMAAAITVGVTLGVIMTRKGLEGVSPVIMAVVNV